MDTDSVNKLEETIKGGEGPTVDFKDSHILSQPIDLARLMVAFANTKGGQIIIGVKDDHTLEGLKAKKGHEEYIMNISRDRCDPPISPSFECVIMEEGDVYSITIPRMTTFPHAVKIDGGKAFYIRVGSTVREPSPLELSNLFNNQDPTVEKVEGEQGNILAIAEDMKSEKKNPELPYRHIILSLKYSHGQILDLLDDKLRSFVTETGINNRLLYGSPHVSLEKIEFYIDGKKDINYCRVNDNATIYWHEIIDQNENGVLIGRTIFDIYHILSFFIKIYNRINLKDDIVIILQFKNVKGMALSVSSHRLITDLYGAPENDVTITHQCTIDDLNDRIIEVIKAIIKKFCLSFGFEITEEVLDGYVKEMIEK